MIKLTLSSAHIGDLTDEEDFGLWFRYVSETVGCATGLTCDVDRLSFADAGEDRISGATEEQREVIREWLSVTGWEAFCAGPWQSMSDEASRVAA